MIYYSNVQIMVTMTKKGDNPLMDAAVGWWIFGGFLPKLVRQVMGLVAICISWRTAPSDSGWVCWWTLVFFSKHFCWVMKVCPDITVMYKLSCQEQVALRGKENYLAMSELSDQICLSLEFLVTTQKMEVQEWWVSFSPAKDVCFLGCWP